MIWEEIDREAPPDGAFLFMQRKYNERERRRLKCPVVCFSRYSSRQQMPCVWPDDHAVGRAGAEHLLSLGLQNLAFVNDSTYYADCREAGFKAVIQRSNRQDIAVDSIRYIFDAESSNIRDVIKWLQGLPLPCGVFAATDPLALLINSLCRKLHLLVPEDIALLGVNNAPEYCEMGIPQISSIRLPYFEMGRRAAALMNRQFLSSYTKSRINRIIVGNDIKIVARHSTDTVAAGDCRIAEALAWLRKTAPCRPVYSNQLQRRFKISRYILENAFIDLLGHKPPEEVARVRESRIKHLLETTDWKIERIAIEAGFKSINELLRFFSRRTGTSPGKWRKQRTRRQ